MFNPFSIKKEATTLAKAMRGEYTMEYEFVDAIKNIAIKSVIASATVTAVLIISVGAVASAMNEKMNLETI